MSNGNWESYEDEILDRQESEADDCCCCPYANVEKCRSQCLEVKEIWNPCISAMQKRNRL